MGGAVPKRNPRKPPPRKKHAWLRGDEALDHELNNPTLMGAAEWLRVLFAMERASPGEGARLAYAAHLKERTARGAYPCLSPNDVARAEEARETGG
jgi:hypothetical protein